MKNGHNRNFLQRIIGIFMPKRSKTGLVTTSASKPTYDPPIDLSSVLGKRRGSRARSFPRLRGNDPKTKCKGTKKGATHYVRDPGEGLSS